MQNHEKNIDIQVKQWQVLVSLDQYGQYTTNLDN